MNQFPKALELPEDVKQERVKRNQAITFAIFLGIAARVLIVAFEFLGVFLFSSSALFLDALSSLFDVFSSIVLLIFVKLATRPPDRNHPFGHGRFEPFIGFQLGMLMTIIGVFLILQQVFALGKTIDHPMHPIAWTFPFFSMIILEGCFHYARVIAHKQKSSALLAEAMHYRIDSLTSAFAVVALLMAAHVPGWNNRIDHLGAIAIACVMVALGVKSAFKNVHELMDRVPDSTYFKRVRGAALKVRGVLDTEKLLILQYGPDAHVNIDIEVEPKMSVEEAHRLTQRVRLEIQKEWPAVRDVMVHVEPYYPNDH